MIGSIIGAAIGAAGSIIGGRSQAKGAVRAADIQAQAAREALEFQKQVHAQTRSDLAPYREAGTEALEMLQGMFFPKEGESPDFSAFFKSPGFEFARDEGIRALDASAAASGDLFSGNTGRELVEFGEGLATQNFDQFVNSLFNLASSGQNAAAHTGTFATAAAGGVSNTLGRLGAARASGVVGQANAMNDMFGNLASVWERNNLSGAIDDFFRPSSTDPVQADLGPFQRGGTPYSAQLPDIF